MLVLKLFAAAVSLGAVACCYVLMRSVAPAWSIPITALFAFSNIALVTAASPQSDLPFALVLFLCLCSCRAYERDRNTVSGHLVVTAALALAGAFIRVAGVVVFPGLFVYLLLHRQVKKACLLLALLLVGYAPWAYRNYVETGAVISATYESLFFSSRTDQMTLGDSMWAALERGLRTGELYLTSTIPDTVTGIFPNRVRDIAAQTGTRWLLPVIGLLVSGILILGFVWRIRQHGAMPGDVVLVFYLGLLLVSPLQATRYMLPILPLLYLYMFTGLDRLLGRARSRPALWAVTVGILIVMAGRNVVFLGSGKTAAADSLDEQRGWITWVLSNTPSDAVLMVGSPFATYLRTQRFAITYIPQAQCTAEGFLAYVDTRRPSHLIVFPTGRASIQETIRQCVVPAVQKYPERFRLVYEQKQEQVSVLQVVY